MKKAECQRIDAFGLWCWRRLLRVLWTARRSNQSILKEISPGCSLMLKLKLQSFGHPMWRADSFGKTLILDKIEGRRRRGWQKMIWLDGITDSMNMGLGNSGSWWWTGGPGMLWFMESQRVRHDWATELNGTLYMFIYVKFILKKYVYLQFCWSKVKIQLVLKHNCCVSQEGLNPFKIWITVKTLKNNKGKYLFLFLESIFKAFKKNYVIFQKQFLFCKHKEFISIRNTSSL